MTQGTEYWEWHAQKEPEPGTMLTAEEIARYANDVITRLERGGRASKINQGGSR